MACSLSVKLPPHGVCHPQPTCPVWRQRTKATIPTSHLFQKTAQDGQANRNKQTQRGLSFFSNQSIYQFHFMKITANRPCSSLSFSPVPIHYQHRSRNRSSLRLHRHLHRPAREPHQFQRYCQDSLMQTHLLTSFFIFVDRSYLHVPDKWSLFP